jgi:D-hydroxyproline dehydrogenase subunit beta
MATVRSRRCVVIGAGIMGASVAARLASSGVQVTLLEADQPGRATSRWSFAWLNSNDKAPRAYHDLNHAGIRAWAELAPDLDGDAWYRPVGHLELAVSDAGRAEMEARVRRLSDWGYPARLIGPAEAAEIEPALRFPQPGGAVAWFPGEGYVLTEPLIARLVARAARQGADVRTGEQGRVTGLEPGPAETLRVRTAAGAILAADDVVCCAGRWTPGLATLAAPATPTPATPTAAPPIAAPAAPVTPAPVAPVTPAPVTPAPVGPAAACPVPLVAWDTPGAIAPGLAVRVGPLAPAGPVHLVHTPEVSLRPHAGGLLHLEAPDAAVDLHTPEPDLRRWAATLLRRAQETVHGLTGARVEEFQVCVRPMPADGQPIVGRLPGTPGLYVAVTHSGVTLAAHLSRLIATDLTTGTPPPDLAPYHPARFLPTP